MSSDRAAEGGETAPRSVEQAIDETRADRNAWRAANWPSIDLVDRPDRDSWNRVPEPLTAEERARLEPGTNPVETDTENPAAEPEETVLPQSERHPRATIVFSDTEMSPDPGRAQWSSSDAGSGAEEAPSEPIYKSAEDVREAFMEGKSVSDVRQDLADQASSASEPTTELYRTDGDLRYERPEPTDPLDQDLEDDDRSWYSRAANKASQPEFIEWVQDTGGSLVQRMLDAGMERPRPTGAHVGTTGDYPVVRESPKEAVQGSELAIALLAGWLVVDHYARRGHDRFNDWRRSRGDIDDAGH